MSTSAQRGHIAWAVQGSKIGAASAFSASALKWQRHRAESVNLGVNDLYDVLPQEVGGTLFVNSSYKNGAFVAGGGRIYTRLESTIGHLLYGAAGKASAYATGSTGANSDPRTTRFMTNSADETQMPWMALRKFTPATTAASGVSEYFMDCRVNALTLNIPAVGPTMAEFTVIGREPKNVDGEELQESDVAFESGLSLGHGCKANISLTDINSAISGFASNGKFTSAQIMIANNISQPDQQMVIGSYHPDDLVPLSRAVQIRLIYKWADAQLYKKVYYDGTANWSPKVLNSEVKIKTASVSNITGKNAPYSLEFVAGDVDWTMSPPQLAGNQLLFTEFTGIVKGGNNGDPATWFIDLVNTKDYSTDFTVAAYA